MQVIIFTACRRLLPMIIWGFFLTPSGTILAQTRTVASTLWGNSGNTRVTWCGATPCPIASVDNPTNARENNSLFASLWAGTGLETTSTRYESWIELGFTSSQARNTPVYIEISGDNYLLESLLAGSQGNELPNQLGDSQLGDHIIEIQAKANTTTRNTWTISDSGFSGDAKVIKDKDGVFFIRIRPSETSFNRIRIITRTKIGLLPGKEFRLNVARIFTLSSGCGGLGENFISFDGSDLNFIGGSDFFIQNLSNGIDGDQNTFTNLHVGNLRSTGSISSIVYFSQRGQVGEQINVVLSASSTISIDELLEKSAIKIFNNGSLRETISLASIKDRLENIWGIDVIELINSGEPFLFPIKSNHQFDIVELQFQSHLQRLPTDEIYLYEIYKSPGNTFDTADGRELIDFVCPGNPAVFNTLEYLPNLKIRWYQGLFDEDYIQESETTDETFETAIVEEDGVIYFSYFNPTCQSESLRIPAQYFLYPEPESENFTATVEGAGVIFSDGIYYYKENSGPITIEPFYREDAGFGFEWFIFDANWGDFRLIEEYWPFVDTDGTLFEVNSEGKLTIDSPQFRDGIAPYQILLQYTNEFGCLVNRSYTFESLGIVLPVIFDNIQAKADIKNDVVITWSSEVNMGMFILERSWDGRIYEELQSFSPTSSGEYSFLDIKPSQARIFYRLRYTDLEKNLTKISEIVRVDLLNFNEYTWKLFPNPSKNRKYTLLFNSPQTIDSDRVNVYDSKGQSVAFQLEQNTPVNYTLALASTVKNGIYFLQILTNNQVIQEKIMLIN